MLIWGLLFGSVGFGFAMYGKRQGRIVPFLAGLGMIGAPYLFESAIPLITTGTVLIALPFFLKL